MNAKAKVIWAWTLLALVVGGVSGGVNMVLRKDGLRMKDKIDLSERVREIANVVGDLSSSPDVLFGQAQFLEVYEAPDVLFEQAVAIYADSACPDLHKEIAGYAMQRLLPTKYFRLVSMVASLAEQGRVSGRLLDKLAFPPLNWRPQLIVNWEHQEARVLLERLANMKQLGEHRRAYIRERVLTGKAQSEYLDLQEAGQIP